MEVKKGNPKLTWWAVWDKGDEMKEIGLDPEGLSHSLFKKAHHLSIRRRERDGWVKEVRSGESSLGLTKILNDVFAPVDSLTLMKGKTWFSLLLWLEVRKGRNSYSWLLSFLQVRRWVFFQSLPEIPPIHSIFLSLPSISLSFHVFFFFLPLSHFWGMMLNLLLPNTINDTTTTSSRCLLHLTCWSPVVVWFTSTDRYFIHQSILITFYWNYAIPYCSNNEWWPCKTSKSTEKWWTV